MSNISRKLRHRFLVIFSMFFLMSTLSYAAGDPVGVLQSVADRLIAALKAHRVSLKSNPSVVYSLANTIVVPHADISTMAKRVLPPQIWNNATPAQRSKFQSEFTTVLVRTYASALADYTDETVHFYPVRGGSQGKNSVQVNSEITRSDGPAISVNYKMLYTGSSWKLYDMSVEGVSLLESFRSQFADELAKGDMDSLTRALAQHNRANSGS